MNDLEKRVMAEADRLQDELYETLSGLVAHRSENHGATGDENNAQPFVASLYEKLGLSPDTYSPMSIPGFAEHEAYWPGNHLEDRTNVCAVWKGTGGGKSVMIAGHVDTVPIGDEAAWTVPPTEGVIRDGRIWGRGSMDDKQGIAAGWYAVRVLQACGVRLRGDVVLSSYCDEENGGGHGALAAVLKYPCDAYANLDGEDMTIHTNGVGGGIFSIDFALDRPTETASPVYRAVRAFCDELEEFGARRRAELGASAVFHGSSTAAQAYRLYNASAGTAGGMDLGRGYVEFICYSLKPEKELMGELDDILKKLAPLFDELGVKPGPMRHTTRYFRPVMPDGPVVSADIFADALAELRGKPTPRAGMCLSDTPMFYHYGGGEVFCFGAGLGFGEYGGAHQPDENMPCDELLTEAKAAILFLMRYAL